MATIFDINFAAAPSGDMNAAAPSGMRWCDASGFTFSDPIVSGGALVGAVLNRVALNRTQPGNEFGDVFESWFVNGGYSAVPGHLEMHFTLSNNSFVSIGCGLDIYDSGSPLFAFTVTAPGVKKVQCKDAYVSPATTLSNSDLKLGGDVNVAHISWNEYSVSFTLNGNLLHTITSPNRPRLHPTIRLNGTARVLRVLSGDLQPDPPAESADFWRNIKNAAELP